jgi:hypothetical protein
MIPTIGRWPDAPDLIEPIVGYRAWRYTMSDRGVQLFPFNLTADDLLPRSEWEGAWATWVTSSCPSPRDPSHLAPDEGCSCGFYALKSPDDVAGFTEAIIFQAAASRGKRGDGAVLGRVLLAGKVIEHETGYRAERARIAEFIPTTTDAGTTLALASRLGLPVEPTLDTTPLFLEMEEFFGQDSSEPPWRPGLLDRLRLRRHSRHFQLLQGAGSGEDRGPGSTGPGHPLGGSSPPAA